MDTSISADSEASAISEGRLLSWRNFELDGLGGGGGVETTMESLDMFERPRIPPLGGGNVIGVGGTAKGAFALTPVGVLGKEMGACRPRGGGATGESIATAFRKSPEEEPLRNEDVVLIDNGVPCPLTVLSRPFDSGDDVAGVDGKMSEGGVDVMSGR